MIPKPATAAALLDLLGRVAQDPAGEVRLDPQLARVSDLLRRLPTVHFNLLRLRFIRGLSVEQVALQCGCAEAAARLWLERALGAFDRQLQADPMMPASPGSGRRRRHARSAKKPSAADAELFQTFAPSETSDEEPAVPTADNDTQAVTTGND